MNRLDEITAGLYSFNVIQSLVSEEFGKAYGDYNDVVITSQFQPIFQPASTKAIGYEALLSGRDQDGHPIAPLELFDLSGNFSELLALDRLACMVHMENFFRSNPGDAWLSLNMNPQVFIESFSTDNFFRDLIRSKNFPSNRILIEILDENVEDEGRLAEAVTECRNLGCMVAVDDFGAGHSNFERVWRLQPDIVKLDRFLTTQAATDSKVKRMLPNIISALHEGGARALLAGVENQDEALVALDAKIDLVQGYYSVGIL